MDFDQLVHSIAAQFKVVWAAPFPFAVVIALVTFCIWRAMEWRYGGKIDRLEENCARLSAIPVAEPMPAVRSPERAAKRESEELAATLHNAARDARGAMADNNTERTADKCWPNLRAAMLTAHKRKGIPLPKETPNARLNVEVGCQLLERVAPLLRLDHDDEARDAAQRLITKFKLEA